MVPGPFYSPDLLKVQDSDGYLRTRTQLCGGEGWGGENPLSDAVTSYRDRALECPGVTLLGNQRVTGKIKSGNIESQIKTVKCEACKRTQCQPCISPQSLIGI